MPFARTTDPAFQFAGVAARRGTVVKKIPHGTMPSTEIGRYFTIPNPLINSHILPDYRAMRKNQLSEFSPVCTFVTGTFGAVTDFTGVEIKDQVPLQMVADLPVSLTQSALAVSGLVAVFLGGIAKNTDDKPASQGTFAVESSLQFAVYDITLMNTGRWVLRAGNLLRARAPAFVFDRIMQDPSSTVTGLIQTIPLVIEPHAPLDITEAAARNSKTPGVKDLTSNSGEGAQVEPGLSCMCSMFVISPGTSGPGMHFRCLQYV